MVTEIPEPDLRDASSRLAVRLNQLNIVMLNSLDSESHADELKDLFIGEYAQYC